MMVGNLSIGKLELVMSDINECSKNGSPYISNCEELHKMVNNLPRYNIPIEMDKIPDNGIYFIFEVL